MYTSDNDVKTAKKRRRQIRDFKGVLHPDDYGSQGEPVRQKTHAQRRGVKTRGSGMKEEEDKFGKRDATDRQSDKIKSDMMSRKKGARYEQVDIYDIILSHLLDEGYAKTPESAEAIMVNMSEEWRESVVEAYKDLPVSKMMHQISRRQYKSGMTSGYEIGKGKPVSMNPKSSQQTGKMIAVASIHDPKAAKAKEAENRRRGTKKD
jgi:hypothetical protein